MVEIPIPTPEELSSRLSIFEDKFRHRYSQQDDGYRETVSLNRVGLPVPVINPWPPKAKRMMAYDDREPSFRRGHGRFQNRRNHYRHDHDIPPHSHNRHSPPDYAGVPPPPSYSGHHHQAPHVVQPPKTPTGSPLPSHSDDNEDVVVESGYQAVSRSPLRSSSSSTPFLPEQQAGALQLPELEMHHHHHHHHTGKAVRTPGSEHALLDINHSDVEQSAPPPAHPQTLPPLPPLQTAEEPGSTGLKELDVHSFDQQQTTSSVPPPQQAAARLSTDEPFDVSVPAFSSENEAPTLAPSQNDVSAILSSAHSSTKVAISASGAERLRRQKIYEERMKRKTEEKRQKKKSVVLPDAPAHQITRKKSALKETLSASAILSESMSQPAGLPKRRKVQSERSFVTGPQKSDEEEIDVEVLEDGLTAASMPKITSLTVSIPLERVKCSKLATSDNTAEHSHGSSSKSHKKSKKNKKEKKSKKSKDREPNLPSQPRVTMTDNPSAGGLKLKISNLKSYL